MKKLLPFEEVWWYLIDDKHVRDEIIRNFKDDAPAILNSVARREHPQSPDFDIDTFLLDLLHNDGRLYKRYTAHGSYGAYHIDIRGLGGVYFYWAPEFDTTGYFSSIEDASAAIDRDWADNLVSSKGRTYRPPFMRSSAATEMSPPEIGVSASCASRNTSVERHHLFHGEPTDAPGRNESWNYYLQYRGNGRWNLITESTDFSGIESLPESKEAMSTHELVKWALERDDEIKESNQSECKASDDEKFKDSKNSLGPYAERLKEIALNVGASYCVKCIDGWVAGKWPEVASLRVLKVLGVARRQMWIRLHHDVYKVATNLGAAYLYSPDKDGYAKVVLEYQGTMSPGRTVKLEKKTLAEMASYETEMQKLRASQGN